MSRHSSGSRGAWRVTRGAWRVARRCRAPNRLAPDGHRVLVVADADEDGLTQLSFRRPLVEFHLDDDSRADPVRLLVRARLLDERGRFALEWPQTAIHVQQR